ncbi:Cephalotocin receptor 2 [Acropora cervicornis]|uniref:Cephalotocin receptor 2 n=1 Tax=Acropora cervicornis TaxID=6130 RepID=A0AAD9QBP4_ACRCE|nr:Cephalotocin receptor 2 [Acropora cervicornis]
MSTSSDSSTWKDKLVGSIVIVIFSITLVLNLLALHYTYIKVRKPSLKKIPHLFVGALSLAGLGIACFQYIPFIASRFHGEWSWKAGVCHFVAFGVLFFGTLTISLVVMMSVERLGAIVFPFCYKESVTFHKCVILLIALVVYSFALAILPQALHNVELNVSTGVCSYTVDSHNIDTKVVVYVMCAHYVLSALIMLLSNITVVYTLHLLDKNSLSDIYNQDDVAKSERGAKPKSKHSNTSACVSFAKMVALMAVCYSVCWTTVLMRVVTLYSLGWHNKYFDQVVLVLTTLDPLINHCVCLWTMSKYRDGYASSLGKVFSCFKPSEEGMFRSAITRLSTISRRSFSRSSTTARSSSMRTSRRKSSAITHTYKQVAQNNQDLPVEPGVEVREIQSDPKELVEQGHSSRNP